ncbi:hypothetical protein BH23CHL2_BH23CHL2_05780 [soil metagenome]
MRSMLIFMLITTLLGACGSDGSPVAPTGAPRSSTAENEGSSRCDDAIPWDEAKNHIGEAATVFGPVVDTEYANQSIGQPTFINLGEPYPSEARFTVVIWEENRSRFPENPETAYMGKGVCVTGTIETFNQLPQIKVSSPASITIADSETSTDDISTKSQSEYRISDLTDLMPSASDVGSVFLDSTYQREFYEEYSGQDTVTAPGIQRVISAGYEYDDPSLPTSPFNPRRFSAECHEYDSPQHASEMISIRTHGISQDTDTFDIRLSDLSHFESYKPIGDEAIAAGGTWKTPYGTIWEISVYWFRVDNYVCEYSVTDPTYPTLPPFHIAEDVMSNLGG